MSHSTPSVCTSWASNGQTRFIVRPAIEHYRCLQYFFPTTRSVRPVDTVTFFPTTILILKVGLEYFLHQAATDIIKILQDQPSTTTLSLKVGDTIQNALLYLADILKQT